MLCAWLGLGPAGPAPDEHGAGVVLMAPDLPDDDADERLVAIVRAAVPDDPAALHVMRYDPAAFDPAQLVAVSQRRAGEHMASAVLWIDLRGPEGYAVFLFEREGERVLGRRVPIVDGATEAAHEAVANIAASVLAESLTGPVTGLAELDPRTLETPAPAPAPLPASPPATDEPSATVEPATASPSDPTTISAPAPEPTTTSPDPGFWRLALSLAYAGQSFARGPLLSHALALGVAWLPAPRTFLGLRYDLVLPLQAGLPAVWLELRRHPVSLEAGHRFVVAPRWDLELAGRVTVDPIRRITDPRSDLEPTAGRWRTFSGAAVGLGAGFAPIRPLRIGLRVGVETLLSRADYAIRDPELRVVVAPYPLRGFVELGVALGWLWRPMEKK